MMLYIRMIFSMLVSLYTGRVVLQVLGVDDFGIYNVVGGVVVLFSFINNFLNTACQRYISMSIVGKDATLPRRIFHTALFIHLIIALLFVLVTETVGLWFVYHELVIPEARFQAAVWLYHIFVLTTCISIIRVPFNAAIIAEEKMSFYAYTSIGETVLRLIIVYLLLIIPFDKLIVYALLHMAVAGIMLLWYIRFSQAHFNYCSISFKYDRRYLKEMTFFSGWNLFGSVADIGYKQGTNIILNTFYGVALNAAMGLATTVRSMIFNFINNFQVASNPQILKDYSTGEFNTYSNLVYKVSKFSYYLMLFFALPAMLNMEYVLRLWLEDVPEYTTPFVMLGLIFSLTDCLHGPLWTSMMATGKIRNYQLVASTILLLNLPGSYLALYLGYSPLSIMVVQIVISVITLAVRLFYSVKYAHISARSYLSQVLLPILLVSAIACPLPYYISTFFDQSFVRLLVTGSLSVICVLASVYFAGVNPSERQTLKAIAVNKVLHFVKKK